MVKRQKEKQYQSARENRTNQQLRSGTSHSHATTTELTQQRILPFTHCALSLVPYETPICNQMGIIFDLNTLMKFVLQYKIDPVTGVSVPNFTKDGNYIRLQMSHNEEGLWQCPILTKPFNDRSKVIAIIQRQPLLSNDDNDDATTTTTTTTGILQVANVYSYEAYYTLNVKIRNYDDLISGQPFHPQNDVLTVYDPNDNTFNQRRNINTFYHMQQQQHQQQRSPETESVGTYADANGNNKNNSGSGSGSSFTTSNNVRHSVTATRVMETLRKQQLNREQKEQQERKHERRKQQEEDDNKSKKCKTDTNIGNTIYYSRGGGHGQQQQPLTVLASDVTGVQHTIGRGGTSSSLTSTATSVSDTNRLRIATDDEIITSQCNVMRYKLKKKGYVRLHTNRNNGHDAGGGTLTIELHCDIVPRTCIKFLSLCRHQRYNDTVFHRLIPKFMIQGGKPVTMDDNKNLQSEGSSIWGKPLDDELDHRLQHNSIGIVSMANSGPNTNQQQFFITFQGCPHLDNKHTVFGIVMHDGIEILKEWEQIPATKKDVPLEEIKITQTEIIVDPAMEAYEYERERIETLIISRQDSDRKKVVPLDDTITASMETTQKKMKNDTGPPQIGQYLPQKQNNLFHIKKHHEIDNKIQGHGERNMIIDSNCIDNRSVPSSSSSSLQKTRDSVNGATGGDSRKTTGNSKFGNFSGW